MADRTLEIVGADPSDKDGIRYWRVTWNDRGGGEGHVSLYSDETYQKRIAPRAREFWTMEEVEELPI